MSLSYRPVHEPPAEQIVAPAAEPKLSVVEPVAAAVPPTVDAPVSVVAAEPEGPVDDASPRVGLFFDDGSHVYLDATDPRSEAFTAIAEELNR